MIPQTVETKQWHKLHPAQCLDALAAQADGLTGSEAVARLQKYGANRLAERKGVPAWKRLLLQFHNVLIYALLGSAAITALLGHWVDTGVIIAVVVINAIIGFIQEGKAEKALAAIRGMLSVKASVLRDGQRIEIEAEDLVPGDVVYLQSGDKIPADLRLIELRSLRVEEAALTGESVAVEKTVEAVAADAVLGDRTNMAYSGTLVTYGQATGLVVATGAQTELGKINAMLDSAPAMTTPLLEQMDRFGRSLMFVISAVVVATFVFALFFRDYGFAKTFLAIVALAVAAIPEGLPAILTIILAIGVQAMARRNAIVRKLPAVETLGAVTVICSDKTGTLTRNEMTVTSVVTSEGLFQVSGIGYQPQGFISFDVNRVESAEHPALSNLIRGGLLCNDSRLRSRNGDWQVEGDSTEGALLTLAEKAGLSCVDNGEEHGRRIRSIPFESEHKFMAVLAQVEGDRHIFIKGAPERILERCSQQMAADGTPEPLDQAYWEKAMDTIARRGERLLALAMRTAGSGQDSLEFADVESGLVFLGLTGIIDPPRDEAIASIAQCYEAGIEVKMITGDHARTAQAIGRQLGLKKHEEVVTGEVLESASDEELVELVGRTDIFARTSPEHKLRLVRALQSRGKLVAMTGDGVNDAPALKTADVGIAMGINGTEAAKEAAEIVLTDDNFASIAHAVEEGRTVYDNIRKSILFLLPTNGGQGLAIMVAVLFGLPELPITPAQILWINMIVAVTLSLAIAFEPAEASVMKRKPRNPSESIVPLQFFGRIAYVSFLLMATSILIFYWKLHQGASLELARTSAVHMLVFAQIFYLLNSRFITESSLRKNILTANPYILYSIVLLLVGQVVFIYLPIFQSLFDTAGIGVQEWLECLILGGVIFLLIEAEKAVVRWFAARGK